MITLPPSQNSPPAHRDLRSSSLPRLRHASQLAKYGGPPPDAVGYPHTIAVSGLHLSYTPALGFRKLAPSTTPPLPFKPTHVLTKAQQYRLAQTSVGSLVGKRVNRHNQRTGERDPWRYWGPGRKQDRLAARGRDVSTGVGVERYWDEECEESYIDDAYILGWLPVDGVWEEDMEAGDVWGERDVSGVTVRVTAARRKRRLNGSLNGWELVKKPGPSWAERDGKGIDDTMADAGDDDGWEVLSVSSAPG